MGNRSVNAVTLLGHLGREAETSTIPNGTTVTKFSVATARRWKDANEQWKEETNWTNVVLWRGEKLAPYLVKGAQVYVQGRIQTRSYDKNGSKVYVTEVVAEDVILLGAGARKPEGDGLASAPRSHQPPAATQAPIDDDDIPF